MINDSLILEAVSMRYPNGFQALSDIHLEVVRGEIVALLGASGSGKSSLLRVIAGLEPLSSGKIIWRGVEMQNTATHKRGVSMMFQDGQLFNHKTVAENIEYGLQIKKVPKKKRATIVSDLLRRVDLAGYENRSVDELSGGQKQRVALARALAPGPDMILLDEPLSALDQTLRDQLGHDLRRVLKDSGTTVILVTHDINEANLIADRTVTIEGGRLGQTGRPA